MSGFLISPHHLNDFEVQKYDKNEIKINGVYSRNSLPKIKDEVYLLNLN